MTKRKAIIVLSFILIILFAFQFLSVNALDSDSVNRHAHNTEATIFATIHKNIGNYSGHIEKPTVHKVSISKLNFLYGLYFFILIYINFTSKKVKSNIRLYKKIKCILSNHYNGTKYKEIIFVI